MAECRLPLKRLRGPKHEAKLRTVSYEEWERVSYEIHGRHAEMGACGVCGRQPGEDRRHDRDHDHETGEIRGLACGGDFGCNKMMPRKLTAELARANANWMAYGHDVVVGLRPYLPRDLTAERAEQIAAYLERVEAFYAAGGSGE